ncbi:MAG: glycosyltransferase family 2 protein [Lachnospiraceae bacterium]|nr:glycosyltransferase family 2 protein [Lachnospiraceae bacterium]
MPKKESLCIILAVYNGEDYLSEQISSILQNSYQDFCLHIYDDCSTDGTKEIIDKWTETHPEQIIYHKNRRNKGVIQNFLQALEELEADYYMLCDQDDFWLKNKIKDTLRFMQDLEDRARKMPAAVFGDAKVVDENLNVLAESFQKQGRLHAEKTDLPHLLMENKLLGCTIMLNHALKEKLGTFPPQIRMHDWWIGLVASAFGTIGFLDEPLLLYRQHGKNIVGNSSQKNYIKNRISHLEKQRESLYRTCSQAEAFFEIYYEELSKEQRALLHAFATLPEQNWFIRRYRILSYGFFKSGFIRNLGVLLLI